MGSHTWVRDAKKPGGGKTFAVGVAAVIPQAPPPKRRKLVWQRGKDAPAATAGPGHNNNNSEPEGETEGAAVKPAPAKKPVPTAAAAKAVAAAVAEKKRQEVAVLKRQIDQRKAELEKSKQSANAAAAAELQAKEAEREHRKRKLEAGFSSAFAAAKEAADADIAASRTPVTFADQVEVDRVLSAGSDHGVLRLAPGADAVAVRRRYREMAVQLHPDKCKVAKAGDAFHRLVKAYQQLSKYAR